MITVRDALVSCITRWLPVLDEPELRAVEGFVLELVIAARESAIDLSARVPGFTAPPAGGARADACSPTAAALARNQASGDSGSLTTETRESGIRLVSGQLGGVVPSSAETVGGGTSLDDSSVIDDPDATTPRRRFDVSDAGDGC